jgi:hypothetical protein
MIRRYEMRMTSGVSRCLVSRDTRIRDWLSIQLLSVVLSATAVPSLI